jgi:hypothetical protein
VLKSGSVDASFPAPSFSPDSGTTPYTVSSDTTVLLDDDPSDGNPHLYAKWGDPSPYLYLGNGDGDPTNDPAVTGLTVNTGATLVLVDQGYWGGGYGTLQLTNDLVIYGTVTSGNLTANGGSGATAGGNGGNITLNSANPPTTNSGTLSAAGGIGPTPGTPGTRTVDGSVL